MFHSNWDRSASLHDVRQGALIISLVYYVQHHTGFLFCLCVILYIKMKWLFVRSYLIQIHISEAISTELRTRLPLRLQEVVRYVGTHNISPCLTFPALLSPAGSALWTTDGCRFFPYTVISVIPGGVRVQTRAWRLPNYYTGLPTHTFTCVSVSLARVFTWVRLEHRLLLKWSESFNTCFVVSAHSRVRVFVCLYPAWLHIWTFRSSLVTWDLLLSPSERVSSSLPPHECITTPAWLRLPDISIFAISTHSVPTHLYSLQHPLLLMLSLSLFATCHHQKKCNALQSNDSSYSWRANVF
jgi:hypothetical protein